MKKSILVILAILLPIENVGAETIIILDDNNNIKQQYSTTVLTPETSSSSEVYDNSPTLPPQEVIVVNPNQPVKKDNSYAPLISGVTGAVVGNIIYDSIHHHHHH